MGALTDRRSNSKARLSELRNSLSTTERLASGKASVYITGSFGRGEGGNFSDLDLFIVGRNRSLADGSVRSQLGRLDEICIKSDLIRTARQLGFPEFSGDGEYLGHFTVHEFTESLGTPRDDVTNTFTARLLLLLESTPLLEATIYREVVGDVIAAFWRDFEGRELRFVPGFLCNDILRLWRTFCVNYEARTERVPDIEKAKGRLKNFKLKHSRLLTCYSGILYLLSVYRRTKIVTPDDAIAMTKLSPTERLEWLQAQDECRAAQTTIQELLRQYDLFLSMTNQRETELLNKLMDDETSKDFTSVSRTFGDAVYKVLTVIGEGNDLYRLLVV